MTKGVILEASDLCKVELPSLTAAHVGEMPEIQAYNKGVTSEFQK